MQVLVAFETTSGERLVRERLERETALASSPGASLFFFKTVEEVAGNFRHGWRQIGKVSSVPLF